MKRNLVTAFASIAGSRLIILVASAVITPLLVRILGFSTYGEYGAVMAVFGLLMILVSSGINSGVRKYMAEERDEEGWADHVFAYYFRMAFGLAVVAAVLLAVASFTGAITVLFESSYESYFYLLAILVVAAQFREYVRRALMGLKLEHVSEPLRVVHKVAFGVAAITFAWAGHGVTGVLLGHILASTLVFFLATSFIARHVSLAALFQPLPEDFPRRELFDFNYLTVVYIFLLTSMYHVDVLMLEGFATSEQVGYYKAALVLVQFLWFVPRSVQSVFIQETSTLWNDGRLAEIQQLATRSTRYTLLLTGLMAIGLGALATTFVPIYYGPDSTPMVLPLLLLLPGTLGFAVARPLLAINHAKGDMRIIIAATGAAAGINLVLNYLLIPQFGMNGAGVATSIGYGSLIVFQVWGARYLGYHPIENARLPQIGLTMLVGGIVIGALGWFVTGPIALLVVPPLGAVVYTAAALATGAVQLSEVAEIVERFPDPIGAQAETIRSLA